MRQKVDDRCEFKKPKIMAIHIYLTVGSKGQWSGYCCAISTDLIYELWH